MAYGTDSTNKGFIAYNANIRDNVTGIQAFVRVDIFPDGTTGIYPTEADRDAMYQTLLTQIAAIPNVSVVSAVKRGECTTPVTP